MLDECGRYQHEGTKGWSFDKDKQPKLQMSTKDTMAQVQVRDVSIDSARGNDLSRLRNSINENFDFVSKQLETYAAAHPVKDPRGGR